MKIVRRIIRGIKTIMEEVRYDEQVRDERNEVMMEMEKKKQEVKIK